MKLTRLIILALVCACSGKSEQSNDLTLNDTIQTASGLQYYYLKKGDGREVEKGAKLDTKLSLMVDDSVVWTSYSDEDSLFSFIIGVDGVIKGFEEMAYIMREGDNVVAILPDSLAYGDEGAGDVIPPNATLVYDRYELVSVSEPKKMLSDTLYPIFENGTAEDMIEAYRNMVNSGLSEQYHMSSKRSLYQLITASERYKELEQIAIAFEEMATSKGEKQGDWYNQLVAILQQGDTARAISRVKEVINMDPEEEYWKTMLEGLENPSK